MEDPGLFQGETTMSASFPGDFSHQLVLEYLRCSGRSKAAKLLEEEAELPPAPLDHDCLERGTIRRKILTGDIIGAVETLNELHADLLDKNQELMFKMKLQAFIEMVRNPGYDLETVLAFASEEFVPCPTPLLRNLEEVMALLAFEDPGQSPLKNVLGGRDKLAAEVNHAILAFEGVAEPRLTSVLRKASWLEDACARERSKPDGGLRAGRNASSDNEQRNMDEVFEALF